MLIFLQIDGQASSIYKDYARMYFAGLLKEGLDKSAFYDGSVVDAEEFIALGMSSQVLLFLVYDTDTKMVCAHFHLNGFMGRMAMVHFSMCKEYQGRKGIRIAKESLKMIFDMDRTAGGPLVTTLTGFTPVPNRLACRFIQMVGFEKKLTIRDACEFKDGHFEDALITIMEAS